MVPLASLNILTIKSELPEEGVPIKDGPYLSRTAMDHTEKKQPSPEVSTARNFPSPELPPPAAIASDP